jgi:UDP-N-acetylmuramate--alanine ligase
MMKKIPLMRRIQNIHFIGIGGSGMSGIAEVLLNQGYNISGSDQVSNVVTKRLESLGAKIYKGHDAKNVAGAHAIVTSSAISPTNPELTAAHQAKLPILPRAQMLAELMRFHYGIAVAGTHGKTTTTSLVASILAEAKLQPTFVIGGILNNLSSNANLGAGEYFVVEADESDASFLYFNPMASIITNIDADHMQTYGGDISRLKQAFLDFLHRLPFYGLAVVCSDNPIVQEILPAISRPVVTYGFNDDANVKLSDFEQNGFSCNFKISWPERKIVNMNINLNLAGKHNALNATAAAIVALESCQVEEAAVSRALSKFSGVGRRMERYGEITLPKGKVFVIDDYGHHPKEIAVTLEALRKAMPGQRLVLAFQPHRYTRTRDLFDEFTQVLSTADLLLLMEIYAASEKPITGITSQALLHNIRQRGSVDPIFVADNNELLKILPNVLKDGDVLLVQGAGSIGAIAPHLKETY